MRYYIITILLFSFNLFSEEPKIRVTQLGPGAYVHTSFRSLNGEFFHSNGLILDAGKGVFLVDTTYVISGHEAWRSKEAFAKTLKLLGSIKRD